MKKSLVLLLIVFLVSGCSNQSILDVILPDQEAPVFFTSNLKNRNQRMINLGSLHSSNISAASIGLRANDNRDGDISDFIDYEVLGFYQGQEGYYYYVRYFVYDRAENFTHIDIPYIVFEDISINSSNYSQFLDFNIFYRQVSVAGLYSNLAYNVDLYLKPKTDFQLLNSTLRYTVDIKFNWTRNMSVRDQNFRYTYYNSNHSEDRKVSGSLQQGLYFGSNSIPLKFEYVSLRDTDYRQHLQTFPCCTTTTHESVRDFNVRKNYIVTITGSATARIYYTDRV
jgi:hypothetical protein